MSQATLTEKQQAKVIAFAAAAREAKSNGKLSGDARADNAAILRIANVHKFATWKANGSKGHYCDWLCVPGYAAADVAAAVAAQPQRSGNAKPQASTPKASGGFVPFNDGKGKCWEARSKRRANGNGGVDYLAPTTTTAKPMNSGKLTVDSLAARVDALDAKLDVIIAKLAS